MHALVHRARLLPIAATPLEEEIEQGGGMKIVGLGIVESAVVLKLVPLVLLSLLVAAALQPLVEKLEVWCCSRCGWLDCACRDCGWLGCWHNRGWLGC